MNVALNALSVGRTGVTSAELLKNLVKPEELKAGRLEGVETGSLLVTTIAAVARVVRVALARAGATPLGNGRGITEIRAEAIGRLDCKALTGAARLRSL